MTRTVFGLVDRERPPDLMFMDCEVRPSVVASHTIKPKQTERLSTTHFEQLKEIIRQPAGGRMYGV